MASIDQEVMDILFPPPRSGGGAQLDEVHYVTFSQPDLPRLYKLMGMGVEVVVGIGVKGKSVDIYTLLRFLEEVPPMFQLAGDFVPSNCSATYAPKVIIRAVAYEPNPDFPSLSSEFAGFFGEICSSTHKVRAKTTFLFD